MKRGKPRFRQDSPGVPNAFGEKAVLKLISGAMIRAAERWRGLPVTDFERRQLEALEAELDTEFPARIGRPVAAPRPKFPALMGLDRLERVE